MSIKSNAAAAFLIQPKKKLFNSRRLQTSLIGKTSVFSLKCFLTVGTLGIPLMIASTTRRDLLNHQSTDHVHHPLDHFLPPSDPDVSDLVEFD